MVRDHYQVLGVSRHATPTEVRGAYVRLAKRHHPDLSPMSDRLPQRLREVQQAYRCLSNDASRAAHDAALETQEREYFAGQRAVHRRLRRYDRRHPRPLPRPYRRRRKGLVVLGIVLVATASVIWFG